MITCPECGQPTKLTATTVREIRKRGAAGGLQDALAREYGITQAQVSRIIARKAWRHVD